MGEIVHNRPNQQMFHAMSFAFATEAQNRRSMTGLAGVPMQNGKAAC